MTPTQKSRAERSERAVVFFFSRDWFHVDGDGWVGDDDGLSRGVSVKVESAEPTRKK